MSEEAWEVLKQAFGKRTEMTMQGFEVKSFMVHPDDWCAVLIDRKAYELTMPGGDRLLGIPVIVSSRVPEGEVWVCR